jgi:hypothetical protein
LVTLIVGAQNGQAVAANSSPWELGSCSRFVSKKDSYYHTDCYVLADFEFLGPSGSKGTLGIDVASGYEVRLDFVDSGNYVKREDIKKTHHLPEPDAAVITFAFDNGNVIRRKCAASRSADYSNDYSSASGDNVFCIVDGPGASLKSSLSSHSSVNVALEVNGGTWNGRLALNGLPSMIAEAEQALRDLPKKEAEEAAAAAAAQAAVAKGAAEERARLIVGRFSKESHVTLPSSSNTNTLSWDLVVTPVSTIVNGFQVTYTLYYYGEVDLDNRLGTNQAQYEGIFSSDDGAGPDPQMDSHKVVLNRESSSCSQGCYDLYPSTLNASISFGPNRASIRYRDGSGDNFRISLERQ